MLDFAREIYTISANYDEVPLLINFIKGKNEEEIYKHLKDEVVKIQRILFLENLETLLAPSVAI